MSLDDRIDSVYNSGIVIGQYSHVQKKDDVFGGWSEGLVDRLGSPLFHRALSRDKYLRD